MAAEIPRPGVEVIQKFKTVSPTIITPTLAPCIVGVCRQVLSVMETTDSGSRTLNNDAYMPLPAVFIAKAAVGSPAVYSGLDALQLSLSINNGTAVDIIFAGTPLTPAQVVAQVLTALSAAKVTSVTAETVGTTQWRLRTIAANDFQQIQVLSTTSPAVLTAFGLGSGKVYQGAGYYAQDELVIHQTAFPDPRKNLSQLAIDTASIQAFLYFGGVSGTLSELRRDQAFLRNGTSQPATVTGSVDLTGLTYPTQLNTKTLILTVDGGSPLTVTFASPADAAAVISQINAVISAVGIASLSATNHLVLTDLTTGLSSTILIGAGTANGDLGLSPGTTTGTTAIRTLTAGSGTALTSLIDCPGQDFTAAATAAQVTGTAAITSGVSDGLTLILDDSTGPQTLTFASANNSSAVLTQINTLFGTAAGGYLTATVNGSTHLVLTHSKLGRDSIIRVIGGTALTALGLTASTTFRGNPYPPTPGDDLYVNGKYYATITQVAPGANVSQLKVDKQVAVTSDLGSSFYIIAKNLPAASRPAADLVVNANGTISVKPDILRDVQGNPNSTGKAQLYIAYQAVRQDVSMKAKNPSLLKFNDTVSLGSQLAPISTDNPLALGIYFALQNSPRTQVLGLGVDEAGSSAPYGTVEGYTRAAGFLEGFEVYAIAPMTHDASVAQVFASHVSSMSEPASKGERIVLVNPDAPAAKLDTLVTSGLHGASLPTSNTFETNVANLGALLLAQGINPVGALAVSAGVYLDVGDGKKYAVTQISGSVLTVKTSSFLPGENDDGYYATTTLSSSLLDAAFALRIRGAALVLSDGTPDKNGMALAYQQMGQGYANRRVIQTVPSQCAATLDSIEQVLPGFYMNAAIAGMIGNQPPQQSFTNLPMAGFTRVIGSNDFFSEKQLNVIAAGGNYVVVQDGDNTPLISRMALTTDMTSIETRTDSILKVVDFVAKFLRRSIKGFIGRFNITQGFLDSLGHVVQGLLGYLVENGIIIGGTLDNIIQDEDNPDTVLFDVVLDPPYPCNYVRLTLVV